MNKVICRPEFSDIHFHPKDTYDLAKNIPPGPVIIYQSSLAGKGNSSVS